MFAAVLPVTSSPAGAARVRGDVPAAVGQQVARGDGGASFVRGAGYRRSDRPCRRHVRYRGGIAEGDRRSGRTVYGGCLAAAPSRALFNDIGIRA